MLQDEGATEEAERCWYKNPQLSESNLTTKNCHKKHFLIYNDIRVKSKNCFCDVEAAAKSPKSSS